MVAEWSDNVEWAFRALAFSSFLSRERFFLADAQRRAQGNLLECWGFGPNECAHRVIDEGIFWRLREYAGAEGEAPILIVPAPIKRPYIFDLAPQISVVRSCLDRRFKVYLVEWTPSRNGFPALGIRDYADDAMSRCVAKVIERTRTPPILMAHSLGGAFAAIYCALKRNMRGLVLLSAPLCFAPAANPFRHALASPPEPSPEPAAVPGSLLSFASVAACPEVFVLEKLADAARCAFDPAALAICARVERWLLDEAALPGRLVAEIAELLYREDRFVRGVLAIGDRAVSPKAIDVPTLAVVDSADKIAPLASIAPFVAAVASKEKRVIEYPGEAGVGLQHLALLAGAQARLRVWPEIFAWLELRRQSS